MTHLEYDGELALLAARVVNTADGGTNTIILSRYEYDYDAVGNRISMQARGNSETYAYNELNVLTEIVSTAGDSPVFVFDSMGNRVSNILSYAATTTCRYDDGNRLRQAGGTSFEYDDNGNLIRRSGPEGVTRYEYNYEGRLKLVAHPGGGSTTYQYDPLGNLLKRTDGTNLTYYVYDGLNLLEELDGSGAVRVRYVNGPNLDEALARVDAEGVTFYLYDGIGNIVDVVSATGAALAHYDYDPFGKLIRTQGAAQNDRLFMARPYDARSGLYYFRYRFYDPAYGRFITPDPLDEGRGNYVYAFNNPLYAKDPMGLMATPIEPQHQLAGQIANPLVAGACSRTAGPLLYQGYFHKYYPEYYDITLSGKPIRVHTKGNIYVTLPKVLVDAGDGLGPARVLVYEPEWFRGYYKPPHVHGPLADVPLLGKNTPFWHLKSNQLGGLLPVTMKDVEYAEGTYRVVFKNGTFKDISLKSNQIKKDFMAADVLESEVLDVYKPGAPQDGKLGNMLQVDGVPLSRENVRFVAEYKVDKVVLRKAVGGIKEFTLGAGEEFYVTDARYPDGRKIMENVLNPDGSIKFDPKTGKPELRTVKTWWKGKKMDNFLHQINLPHNSTRKAVADHLLTRRFWSGATPANINGSTRFLRGVPAAAGYGLQVLPIYFAMKAPSGYERAREAAGGIGSAYTALGFSVIGGMIGDGPGIFIGGFIGGTFGDMAGREALDQALDYGQRYSVPLNDLPNYW